jgi:ubiquinone/menaquinone biosynthesis C-methylase UbiE
MDPVQRWVEEDGVAFLKNIGITRGQTVLDFGCGAGNYTIPAAALVGKEGKVYALDKKRRGFWPGEGLDKLTERAGLYRLENIAVMKTSGGPDINLPDRSVDVVLLYDTLHYYYFPEKESRIRLLGEIHRVLGPEGFLSFYPGDPELSGNSLELETILREIKKTGFRLEGENISG